MLFVPCDLLIWASAGNQLIVSIPYLVVTASICYISLSGTSIAKHPQISSNHFSCISYCEQLCFALTLKKLSESKCYLAIAYIIIIMQLHIIHQRPRIMIVYHMMSEVIQNNLICIIRFHGINIPILFQ